MQIALVGLGKMGGNRVRRLLQGSHTVVAYDRSSEALAALVAEGARGASSLETSLYVDDSVEGRWTVNEAIALAVRVPTIAASRFARFTSGQDHKARIANDSALRNELGGHAIKKA